MPVVYLKLKLSLKIVLLAYAIATAFLIAIFMLLFQIGEIVHGQLYDYGLQFSYQCAAPYWTIEWLIAGLLGCVVAINILSISYLILSRRVPRQRQTLDKNIYQKLKRNAEERGIGVQELLRAVIIPEWLKKSKK